MIVCCILLYVTTMCYTCVAIGQGDVKTATGFHERHQELAQAVDIPEEQKKANTALINVREREEGRAGSGGDVLICRFP